MCSRLLCDRVLAKICRNMVEYIRGVKSSAFNFSDQSMR